MTDIEASYAELTAEAVTEDVVRDINLLLPQLSGDPRLLTAEWLVTVLHQTGRVFTAAVDGRIIGIALLIRKYTFLGFKDELEYLVVDEAFRGLHAGLELTKMVVAAAHETDTLGLYLMSRPERKAAHGVYAATGFEPFYTQVLRYNSDRDA